jgi:hypothetical protein
MIILPWRSPKLPFDVSERMGCKIRIETARFDAIYDRKSKRVMEGQDSAASHRLERPRFT